MATERKGLRLVSLGIFLASLFQNSVSAGHNKCPNIHVVKNEIIQVKESLREGAQFISSRNTLDARECYQLCCDEERCDLAQLQYKNISRRQVGRVCFLFRCGHPSRCFFKNHEHHATIHFAKREKAEEVKPATSLQQPHHSNGGCHPGVPVAMCQADPCLRASCRANPYAKCMASFCGTCHAEFFDDDGARVKCDGVVEEIDSEEKDLETPYKPHQEETGQVDKENKETAVKEEKLPTRKPTTEAELKHFEHHNGDADRFPFEGFEHGIEKSEQSTPTVKPTTTELPTTFHHWREFVDNNPNFPIPTHKKEEFEVDWESKLTPAPTMKETTRKTSPTTKQKVTEKPTTQKETPAKVKHPPGDKEQTHVPGNKGTSTGVKTHKELPTQKVTSVQDKHHDISQVRPPVIESKFHKNGTDVVLIENNHLKIVENKAVLPLAIFLVVAILLLFVVALRLRVVKNKLKRRPFATDDADYLINGMYL